MRSTSSRDVSSGGAPDLFQNESTALAKARAMHSIIDADAAEYRQSLGELIEHFQRLMRETRRLIGRSDRAEREMQVLAQQLAYRASHDALTGVLNRSAVIERTTKVLRTSSAVMIILDIDEFKRINDDYGHPTGDAVISGVVDCLRGIVGEQGFIGRVGGEEFTVLLPGHEPASGAILAERMREAISDSLVVPPVERRITASFGVSINAVGTCFDTAYGLADAALYRAKRSGRNRVEFADR
ncbi:diguanylate cyclase (GGDEF)-like protein [Paraburkholderia youngii]|uniref:diguanylate cyclase n=1 Tax=Paraburkholderia youngii TaxID=2782701 RepID=A0A7Y6MZZ3_9BURK|nr:GGDEF domain-containing protein [Paraburkholderia youngii]NUY00556.1 GGDEF domain-containing protein [Paraburkholderia youngii]NVI04021.1 GGDEF domain-containing protein [Paraburkholderia youngii]